MSLFLIIESSAAYVMGEHHTSWQDLGREQSQSATRAERAVVPTSADGRNISKTKEVMPHGPVTRSSRVLLMDFADLGVFG
jgi:hypothetical protein